MEFVKSDELDTLLRDHEIEEVTEGEDLIHLRMADREGAMHLHLACEASPSEPRAGAEVRQMDKERLPAAIEHILHLLHVSEILLIPVAKWRNVFDAVAFSLAENEDWQQIDAAATVELNTRDPLLCDPAGFHTLIALVGALLSDAETADQGLMMLTPAAPVLIEVVPDGAVRLSLGDAVLADEVSEALVG